MRRFVRLAARAAAMAALFAAPASGAPGDAPPDDPLLFTGMRLRQSSLYVTSPGDTAPVRLTEWKSRDNYGRWSPDGVWIAYQSRTEEGAGEIFLMPSGGGVSINITSDPAWEVLPAWSPDGQRIAFMSTRGFELGSIGPFPGHVYVAKFDGSDPRQVTREPLTSSLGPSDWSPDGRTLLIARSSNDQIDLYTLDVETGAERRLTDTPVNEYSAAYSPDGAWIACHVEDESASQIAVMRADGSGRRIVTRGPGWRYGPRWSPDGAWLVYTAEGAGGDQYDVRAVRFADGYEVVLVATPEDEREASWKPAGGGGQDAAPPPRPSGAAAPDVPDSVSLGDDLYVKRIDTGLWLHVSSRELDGRPAWSNGVIVVGAKGAIVIDTPWEDDQTVRLLDWMNEAIDAPVTGVVVTHFHDDRMGGIRTVHARGIPTYGSTLTARRAKREGDPPPSRTFRDHVGLSTGTDSLDVFYPGPGHTRDNIVVWLPRPRLLVGGCMIRSARARSLGFTGEADLKRWPASLKKVRARCAGAEVVIPGHGAVAGVDALDTTARLLREQGARP